MFKVKDASKKRLLLSKLKLFRDHQLAQRPPGDDGSRDDQIPLARVDHDMTQAQRALRKELVAQARADSALGPHKYAVRGPPWEMKIISLSKLPTRPTNNTAPQNQPTLAQKNPAPAGGAREKAPHWFLNPEGGEAA